MMTKSSATELVGQAFSVAVQAGSETELRRKVTEQLTTCLAKAGEELKAEGYDEPLPLPVDVAAEVEQQLYTLHGG